MVTIMEAVHEFRILTVVQIVFLLILLSQLALLSFITQVNVLEFLLILLVELDQPSVYGLSWRIVINQQYFFSDESALDRVSYLAPLMKHFSSHTLKGVTFTLTGHRFGR